MKDGIKFNLIYQILQGIFIINKKKLNIYNNKNNNFENFINFLFLP
jgi:hypothetical protein